MTERSAVGRGVGTRLLDEAPHRAKLSGASQQRVDCWRGSDRRLVRYYRRAGFSPAATFEVGGWQGQVLERRVDQSH